MNSLVRLSRSVAARSAVQQPLRTLASAAAAPSTAAPIKTALYDDHVKLGGKMVEFAGYSLPVQYDGEGVLASHLHVRQNAGLFDVSHMGQLRFHGANAVTALEKLVVADIANLPENSSCLSVITNEQGGIIDDCMITKRRNYIAMVVNGACKHKDMAHFKSHLASSGVRMDYLDDFSLVALQGPAAAKVLRQLLPSTVNLRDWAFLTQQDVQVAGINCVVTRCGYTGEDGFEIACHNKHASQLLNAILHHKEVHPTGLAVRDSLRLEAGLCLYGHDLNETITPIEAGLAWTITKVRRQNGGFLGAKKILEQLQKPETVARKRVGLEVNGPPSREGCEVTNASGKKIGEITSGSFSPCLKKSIAMGYLDSASAAVDTAVKVVVRGKPNDAKVVKMPFFPTRYHRVGK